MAENNIIQFNYALASQQVKDSITLIRDMISNKVLIADIDYGPVPGTEQKVLKKPGAEKLANAHQLAPKFVDLDGTVQDWLNGFFSYRYECQLYHYPTGILVSTGIGSCNSREAKYGYRWVKSNEVPEGLDKSTLKTKPGSISEFEFAIQKKETSGKYGKPSEYWQRFEEAIANGTAKPVMRKTKNGESVAYEIDETLYRIPNPDIYDIVNTIDKMSQKRAFVAAVLNATGASQFFTQDLDEYETWELEYTGYNIPAPKEEKKQPEPEVEATFVDENILSMYASTVLGDRYVDFIPELEATSTKEAWIELLKHAADNEDPVYTKRAVLKQSKAPYVEFDLGLEQVKAYMTNQEYVADWPAIEGAGEWHLKLSYDESKKIFLVADIRVPAVEHVA